MGLTLDLESSAAHRLPPSQAADGRAEASGPRVWAVGGGKGGVGKSVVTAALAMALGRRGRRCAVVDLDLGGPNLHTLLGLRPPILTLSHFLSGEVSELRHLLCKTPYPNLWLLSSSRALLDSPNSSKGRRDRILRHVHKLPVDEVFLDLSAGSTPAVVDFFVGADRGLLVVAPEPTAVENAYQFLKVAFYRALRHEARRSAIRTVLEEVLSQRRYQLRSPHELLRAVAELDADAGRTLEAHAKAFAPTLVMNQVSNAQHRRVGWEMRNACREHLGAQMHYLGALEHDECVREAVREGKPVLERYPGCVFSRSADGLARRVLDDEPYLPQPGSEDFQGTYAAGRQRVAEIRLGRHGIQNELGGAESEEPAPAFRPDAPPPPVDFAHPGASLRRRREHLGLDLDEMERRTRIRTLARIEEQCFAQLPPAFYLRGQLVQYARALGIAEPELLAEHYLARLQA